MRESGLGKNISFGLPEFDDRYNVWRVPMLKARSRLHLGEIVVDARNSLVLKKKTTSVGVIEDRILQRAPRRRPRRNREYLLSSLRNTIALGDSEEVLDDLPSESVDLIFTSPPYYNARVEYSDYTTYQEYLGKLERVIAKAHSVLRDGCFFVINVSPVLVRRSSRGEESRRIAVPFDLHAIFTRNKFDFVDDIIWEKPKGAGWATGRGRRFAADRNPLQYKPVPITEYVLVYRKHSEYLIDWHIRKHPDQNLVKKSKIRDGYEKYNIWRIKPTHTRVHPAVFPRELAERVISYYSFVGDVVLDPFAGIGTVAHAAVGLKRRFVMIESKREYVDVMASKIRAPDTLYMNYAPRGGANAPLEGF